MDRAPARVVLLGVTPARIALGMDLSPEVLAVMPELVARVVAEVGGGAGPPRSMAPPSPPGPHSSEGERDRR